MSSRWRRVKPVGPHLGSKQRTRKGKQPPFIRTDDVQRPFGSTPGSTGHRNQRQYLTKGDRVAFHGHWGTITAMKRPTRRAFHGHGAPRNKYVYPRALVRFDDPEYQTYTQHHWIDCRHLKPMMKI